LADSFDGADSSEKVDGWQVHPHWRILSEKGGLEGGDLNEKEVVAADLVLQLPQRLDERHAAQGEGDEGSG